MLNRLVRPPPAASGIGRGREDVEVGIVAEVCIGERGMFRGSVRRVRQDTRYGWPRGAVEFRAQVGETWHHGKKRQVISQGPGTIAWASDPIDDDGRAAAGAGAGLRMGTSGSVAGDAHPGRVRGGFQRVGGFGPGDFNLRISADAQRGSELPEGGRHSAFARRRGLQRYHRRRPRHHGGRQ